MDPGPGSIVAVLHVRPRLRRSPCFSGVAFDFRLWCRGRMNGDAHDIARRGQTKTLAFGFWLASRGLLVRSAIVLAAGMAIAGAMSSFWLVHHGVSTLETVPLIASEALAWGAGLSLAGAASMRMPYRDAELGVLSFALARGATIQQYVRGRMGGIVLWTFLCVGGGTLVTIAGTIAAVRPTEDVMRASAGALIFSLAFGGSIAPVAMATLGARSRMRGYVALLLVVGVPELVAPWTSRILPDGWSELTSLPAALGALRSVTEESTDWLLIARALAGLTLVATVSFMVTVGHVSRAAERVSP